MQKNWLLFSAFFIVIFIYFNNFLTYFINPAKSEPVLYAHSDTSMQFISPGHPEIQYSGRIDFSNKEKPSFSYPGVTIKARFEGTAVDIVLEDVSNGTNGNSQPENNYYNVIIDDQQPIVLKLNETDTLYRIARNLPDTSHTIEVIKRTESSVGESCFSGFRILTGKRLLPLPDKPSRKIEFIGNSITCGYGNEGKSPHEKFKASTENNYLAFGAVTSRKLHAEYLAVCYSGIGVYRNFGGSTGNTMPVLYDRISPGNARKKWNFKNFSPDAIVIDLGTNDFYLGNNPDSASFVNGYHNFINTIRAKQPAAKIFCVVGPMMNGLSWKLIQQYISALVKRHTLSGDTNVYYFALTPCSGSGSDYHPSVAQHQAAATELSGFIKSKMNW